MGADTCTLCFEMRSEIMKKCAACKDARYCSKDCQRTDWPKHKIMCAGTRCKLPNGRSIHFFGLSPECSTSLINTLTVATCAAPDPEATANDPRVARGDVVVSRIVVYYPSSMTVDQMAIVVPRLSRATCVMIVRMAAFGIYGKPDAIGRSPWDGADKGSIAFLITAAKHVHKCTFEWICRGMVRFMIAKVHFPQAMIDDYVADAKKAGAI